MQRMRKCFVMNKELSSRIYIPIDSSTDGLVIRDLTSRLWLNTTKSVVMVSCNVWGPSFLSQTITWGSEVVEKAGLREHCRGLTRFAFSKG